MRAGGGARCSGEQTPLHEAGGDASLYGGHGSFRGASRARGDPAVRATATDLLALATAFRDLHASPVHAAAVAHAIEGKPHDTAALRDAVAAWASLPLTSDYSSASLQIEDSLVRVHSWLRALLSAWKRSGEVVPLSSEAADKSRTGGQQPDELLLGADEQRIVLVELEAAPPAGEVAPSSSTSSAAAAVATNGVSGCNGAPSAAATTSGDAPSAESQRQRAAAAAVTRRSLEPALGVGNGRASGGSPHAERPAAAEATGTGGGGGRGGVAAAADSESYRLRGDSSSLASQQRRALARTLHRKAKCEASISIELLGYDKSLRTAYEQRQARLFASRNAASAEAPTNEQKKQGIKSDGQELQPQMVRSLPVVGSVCVSRMEIGQRSINFGECESYTPVEKSIILHNRAATPLLYKIAKTGRHASFDVLIRAEDRRGCVRPYGSRQVRFVFRPSLAGAYRETLSIHNVQDKEDVQEVTLKAMVKRAEPFLIKAPSLEFGPLLLNKPCHEIRRVTIVNVSRGSRTFTIECLPEMLLCGSLALAHGPQQPASWWRAKCRFSLESATADGADNLLAQEKMRDEQLETLERKLRIATRKRKVEKAEKLRRKIAAMKAGETLGAESDAVDSDASDWYNSESESEEPRALQERGGQGMTRRKTAGQVSREVEDQYEKLTFKLGRGGTQTIAVTLIVCTIDGVQSPSGAATVSGQLRVADSRNQESAQLLPFTTCVCSDLDELKQAHAALLQGGGNADALHALPELRHADAFDAQGRTPTSPAVGANQRGLLPSVPRSALTRMSRCPSWGTQTSQPDGTTRRATARARREAAAAAAGRRPMAVMAVMAVVCRRPLPPSALTEPSMSAPPPPPRRMWRRRSAPVGRIRRPRAFEEEEEQEEGEEGEGKEGEGEGEAASSARRPAHTPPRFASNLASGERRARTAARRLATAAAASEEVVVVATARRTARGASRPLEGGRAEEEKEDAAPEPEREEEEVVVEEEVVAARFMPARGREEEEEEEEARPRLIVISPRRRRPKSSGRAGRGRRGGRRG